MSDISLVDTLQRRAPVRVVGTSTDLPLVDGYYKFPEGHQKFAGFLPLQFSGRLGETAAANLSLSQATLEQSGAILLSDAKGLKPLMLQLKRAIDSGLYTDDDAKKVGGRILDLLTG